MRGNTAGTVWGCLPWRGPAGCPEFGLKRGARRSFSCEVSTASLEAAGKQTSHGLDENTRRPRHHQEKKKDTQFTVISKQRRIRNWTHERKWPERRVGSAATEPNLPTLTFHGASRTQASPDSKLSLHYEHSPADKTDNSWFIALFDIHRSSVIQCNIPSLSESCFPVLLSKKQRNKSWGSGFTTDFSLLTYFNFMRLHLLFVDLLSLLHLLLHLINALS